MDSEEWTCRDGPFCPLVSDQLKRVALLPLQRPLSTQRETPFSRTLVSVLMSKDQSCWPRQARLAHSIRFRSGLATPPNVPFSLSPRDASLNGNADQRGAVQRPQQEISPVQPAIEPHACLVNDVRVSTPYYSLQYWLIILTEGLQVLEEVEAEGAFTALQSALRTWHFVSFWACKAFNKARNRSCRPAFACSTRDHQRTPRRLRGFCHHAPLSCSVVCKAVLISLCDITLSRLGW